MKVIMFLIVFLWSNNGFSITDKLVKRYGHEPIPFELVYQAVMPITRVAITTSRPRPSDEPLNELLVAVSVSLASQLPGLMFMEFW